MSKWRQRSSLNSPAMMVSGKHECRFKGFLRMEEQEWEWCFLYNGEASKLNCARCEIKKPDSEILNTQEKIIA